MADSSSPLSPAAAGLLAYLRWFAARRSEAVPDRQLAEVLGVPARNVIDLADELLEHGHVVVAEVSPPMGRWLCTEAASDEELGQAAAYGETLRQRGVRILMRRQRLQAAIRRTEARRQAPADHTGQSLLWAPEPQAVTRW